MAVTILEERPEARVGHVGPVFVTSWYSELTVEALDMLERHQTALAQKYGQVTLVSPGPFIFPSSTLKLPVASVSARR